jgi:hypothetical protein
MILVRKEKNDEMLQRFLPPNMIPGCRLDIPDITSIASELTALDGFSDGILIADGTTSGVDKPCTFLEVFK